MLTEEKAREIAARFVSSEIDDGINDWSGVAKALESILLQAAKETREETVMACSDLVYERLEDFNFHSSGEIKELILSLLPSKEEKEKGHE